MGGTAVKPSAWRKMLSKKWAAPAAFMAAAAIIVTLMWIYRGEDQTPAATTTTSGVETSQGGDQTSAADTPSSDTLEVLSGNETMQWPVVNQKDVKVVAPFYDASASDQDRQAALIQSGNTFMTNTGIDLARSDDKTFDVTAALSGTVVVAEKQPLNGNVIEIKHADGVVTLYESLADLQVKVGDVVKQGTLIAHAGRSELEQDLGNHLHFEVRKDGKPINPSALLAAE